MKIYHFTTLLFGLALATLTSCVTTETTTTFPDGRVVKEKTTAPATETVKAITEAAAAAAIAAAQVEVDQGSHK